MTNEPTANETKGDQGVTVQIDKPEPSFIFVGNNDY